MIDRLLKVLTSSEPPALDSSRDLKLAVAALLVEAARMDSTFADDERGIIERLLVQRFELTREEVETLIGEAQRRVENSAQYFPFTSQITRQLECDQRAEIIEMLWRVVYADGVLGPHEDMLVRQIAGLIHVPDRERGLARQRALSGAKQQG
jgi:uncharacterized tellurite resistance protein B-like protein